MGSSDSPLNGALTTGTKKKYNWKRISSEKTVYNVKDSENLF